MLANSEDAMLFYVTYLRMHGDLLWHCREALASVRNPPTSSPSPSSVPAFVPTTLHGVAGFFSSGWPVAYLIATVISSIGLLVGAFTYVSPPGRVAATHSTPATSAEEPAVASVGRVTGMAYCRWARNAVPLIVDDAVPMGREIRLESGLLEITYGAGAKVILQGPVTYEVESPAGGFLSVGKMTARVESTKTKDQSPKTEDPNPKSPNLQTSKFIVRTPTAIVTDLGTEFGVQVSRDRVTQVHVLQGAVDARTVGSRNTTSPHRLVTAGHAIEVGRAGETIEPVTFVPHSFIRTVRPVADAPAKTAYMKAVLADNPIGYWRLGESGGTMALDSANNPAPPHYGIQNGMAGVGVTLGGAAGAIFGETDRAATFNGDGYIYFSISDSEPFNFDIGHPFTIEAWFRTDAKSQFMGIVSKGRHYPGVANTSPGYFLGVGPYGPNRSFGPYVQLEGGGVMYRCAGGELNDGKWHHLVARYCGDRGLDSLTLFVDGKRIATEQTVSGSEGKIDMQNQAPLRIGCIESEELFVGALDEVAIYGWAVDEASIARHYQAGVKRRLQTEVNAKQ
jgi:hypothetical protein